MSARAIARDDARVMRLYQGWTSSASWRVRWALALKGVRYESVWIDVAAGETRAIGRASPLATVPAIELDDGRTLAESVAIVEWLDETIPEPPLYPRDPFERARVRQVVELVNAGIHPLQNTIVRRAIGGDDEGRAWAARWIERGLAAVETIVRETPGPFSFGAAITAADLFVTRQVCNAERHGASLAGLDRVRAIYAACLATKARATEPEEAKRLAGR